MKRSLDRVTKELFGMRQSICAPTHTANYVNAFKSNLENYALVFSPAIDDTTERSGNILCRYRETLAAINEIDLGDVRVENVRPMLNNRIIISFRTEENLKNRRPWKKIEILCMSM